MKKLAKYRKRGMITSKASMARRDTYSIMRITDVKGDVHDVAFPLVTTIHKALALDAVTKYVDGCGLKTKLLTEYEDEE